MTRDDDGGGTGGLVLSLNNRIKHVHSLHFDVDEDNEWDNAVARRQFIETYAQYIVYDATREAPTGNYLTLDWDVPSHFLVHTVTDDDEEVVQARRLRDITFLDMWKADLKPKKRNASLSPPNDATTTSSRSSDEEADDVVKPLISGTKCIGLWCKSTARMMTPDRRYGFCSDTCFNDSAFAVEY